MTHGAWDIYLFFYTKMIAFTIYCNCIITKLLGGLWGALLRKNFCPLPPFKLYFLRPPPIILTTVYIDQGLLCIPIDVTLC